MTTYREIAAAVDQLSDSDVEKFAQALDEMDFHAERRIHAINSGRFLAQEVIKQAAALRGDLEKAAASSEETYELIKEASTESLVSVLGGTSAWPQPMHALTADTHYTQAGGAALSTLISAASAAFAKE